MFEKECVSVLKSTNQFPFNINQPERVSISEGIKSIHLAQ